MRLLILFFCLIAILQDGIQDLSKIGLINKYKKLAAQAFEQANYKNAETYYRYLTDSLKINEPAVWLNLGHTYLQLNQSDMAAQCYDKALVGNDKFIASWAANHLGVLSYQQNQDKEKAKSLFKEALRYNPNNTEARHNLEWISKLKNADKKQQNNSSQGEKNNKDQEKKQDEQNQKNNSGHGKNDQKDSNSGKGQDNQKNQNPSEGQGSNKNSDKNKDGKGDKADDTTNDKDRNNEKSGENSKNKNDKKEQDEQQTQAKNSDNKNKNQNKDNANSNAGNDPTSKDSKENAKSGIKQAHAGGKDKTEQLIANPDVLEKMGLSEQRARALLEAMKSGEIQYIQQMKKESPKTKKSSNRPDW